MASLITNRTIDEAVFLNDDSGGFTSEDVLKTIGVRRRNGGWPQTDYSKVNYRLKQLADMGAVSVVKGGSGKKARNLYRIADKPAVANSVDKPAASDAIDADTRFVLNESPNPFSPRTRESRFWNIARHAWPGGFNARYLFNGRGNMPLTIEDVVEMMTNWYAQGFIIKLSETETDDDFEDLDDPVTRTVLEDLDDPIPLTVFDDLPEPVQEAIKKISMSFVNVLVDEFARCNALAAALRKQLHAEQQELKELKEKIAQLKV